MSTIFLAYITVTTIGVIAMIIRALGAFSHSPERLRAVIILPVLSGIISVLYSYLLAEKAFIGFVRLLRFGFFSDLLMYFVGLHILVAVVSVPVIPWLLSSSIVKARIWGGAGCLSVAIWLPFCQEFASASSYSTARPSEAEFNFLVINSWYNSISYHLKNK